jgi:hypothetical protein
LTHREQSVAHDRSVPFGQRPNARHTVIGRDGKDRFWGHVFFIEQLGALGGDQHLGREAGLLQGVEDDAQSSRMDGPA